MARIEQTQRTVAQTPQPRAGNGAATIASAVAKPSARTPARKKARQLAKHLRGERPDYAYLKQVFRHLREELEVEPPKAPKRLPYVPTEEEVRAFYEAVWKAKRTQDVVMTKTLLYTGVRVSELVKIRLKDVDLDRCQIRANEGKGKKDRVVPFPAAFKETLALHSAEMQRRGASHLFESSWKKGYTDRGVRKILARYAERAGLERPVSPHKMRHFLFTWLKKQGVDDALIQPYSGHSSRKSLEVYSLLAIGEAQGRYDEVMGRFPV
jgi:integrase/recombinase XerD